MSLARSLGRSAAIYGVSVLLQRVAAFLLLPLYTHVLSKPDLGQVAAVDFVVGLVALVVGLNLNEALTRIHAEVETAEGKARVVATALVASGGLALVTAIGLGLGAPWIAGAVLGPGIDPRLFVLALATMALDACAAPVFTYLRILDRAPLFLAFSLMRLATVVVLNLLFLLVLDLGVYGCLASNVIASGLQAAVSIAWASRRLPLLRPSREAFERLARFSLPLVPASLCASVLHGAGRWVLARESALDALAVYFVAFQIGNVVSSGLVQPFNLVWSTRVYEVARRPGGHDEIARVFLWFGFLLAWAATGLSLLFPLVEFWVGPKYHEAVHVVPLVALGYVFFGLAFVVHFGILWSKRTGWSLAAAALAAAVNVVANLALAAWLPRERLHLGPAIAGAAAFAVLAVARERWARRFVPIEYEWRRVLGLLALAAACVLTLEVLELTGPAGALVRVLLAFGYGPAAVIAGLVPREDVVALVRSPRTGPATA